MSKRKIIKVWVDSEGIYATTEDNLTAGYKFNQWKRLANASQKDRENYYLTYGGVHWPSLDEDLSFEGMFEKAGFANVLQRKIVFTSSKPLSFHIPILHSALLHNGVGHFIFIYSSTGFA